MKAQLAGGKQPAMPGDDAALAVNKVGFVQPDSRMLAAICATCASLWCGRFARMGSANQRCACPITTSSIHAFF